MFKQRIDAFHESPSYKRKVSCLESPEPSQVRFFLIGHFVYVNVLQTHLLQLIYCTQRYKTLMVKAHHLLTPSQSGP